MVTQAGYIKWRNVMPFLGRWILTLALITLFIVPSLVLIGPVTPAAADNPIEITALRTQHSTTTLLGYTPDGKARYSIDSYIGSINYLDGSGSYQPIDTDIAPDGILDKAPYHLEVFVKDTLGFSITDKADQLFNVTLSKARQDSKTADLTPVIPQPIIKDNTVTWPNVYPDVDVVLTAGPDGVNLSRIIKSSSAPKEYDMTIEEFGKGDLTLLPLQPAVDAQGQLVSMQETATPDGRTEKLTSTIIPEAGKITKAITYPIVDAIDVQIDISANDGYAWGANFDTAGSVISLGQTAVNCRGFFVFPGITIPAGATTSNCSIQLFSNSQAGTPALKIYANDTSNSTAPTNYTATFALVTTSAGVDWDGVFNDEAWNTSPDISGIFTEMLVDRIFSTSNVTIIIDDDQATNSQTNQVRTYDWDTTPPLYSAQLHIEYSTGPSVPTVATNAVSGIGVNSATLSANINNTGGENATMEGFEWGILTGNYTANWTQSINMGLGEFHHPLSGLIADTQYFYKAFAQNSAGIGYSAEDDFTTLSGSDNSTTTTGSLSLVATIECIGVVVSFSGDADDDSTVVLEYKETSGSTWLTGMDMYAEFTDNQHRGSILGLITDTSYNIRVTFSDADGVIGDNPVTGSITTMDDSPPLGTVHTHYVDDTGNDANSGNITHPWLTIQHAANTVVAGDTVYVREGTYNETVTITADGNSANYISFLPYPGETATLDGTTGTKANLFYLNGANYVRIKGFNIVNSYAGSAIQVTNSGHCFIEYNTISEPDRTPANSLDGGIDLKGSSNCIVQYNDISSSIASVAYVEPIMVESESGATVIRYNTITPSITSVRDVISCSPESASGTKDCDIYGNIIVGSWNWDGIQMDGNGTNTRCWNNTILTNSTSTFSSMSVNPITDGPCYVFRNIANRTVKTGGGSFGRVYFYHNTFYLYGSTCGWQQTDPNMGNIVTRNNIIHGSFWVFFCREGDTDTMSMDYDNMYTSHGSYFVKWVGEVIYGSLAAFQAGTVQADHAISVADNKFVDAGNNDFNLLSNSPDIDEGILIPGFNDANSQWPYKGAAPDIGAYEYGGVPTVNTVAASSVEETIATLNGDVVDDGGLDVTRWFFWDTDLSAPYSDNWSEGLYGAGTYSHPVTGLNKGDKYVVMASANNTNGTANGTPLYIMTKPDGASGLFETDNGTNWITLMWNPGEGLDSQTIRYSYSGYPATINDGAQGYTGADITANVSGLNDNETVYFSLFTQATEDGTTTTADIIGYTTGTTDLLPNHAPVLDPIGDKSVDENAWLQFTANATDIDLDILAYTLSNNPTGSSMNSTTGVFSWTPTYSQAGVYDDVEIIVSDGYLTDSENITITVNNINRPPVLAAIGNKVVTENSTLQFTISATDPDSNPMVYSASNLPTGASFNATSKQFSWSPNGTQDGVYPNVMFEVTDNGSLSDSENITITVNDLIPPATFPGTQAVLAIVPLLVCSGFLVYFVRSFIIGVRTDGASYIVTTAGILDMALGLLMCGIFFLFFQVLLEAISSIPV